MGRLRKEIPRNTRLVEAFKVFGGYDVNTTNFTRTVAKDMIDKGIVDVPEDPLNFRTDAQCRNNKISSTVRSLNDHLGYEDCTHISGDWIVKYCRLLGCTPDYLYGFQDDPNRIQQAVCDLTGLNLAAVIQQCTLRHYQYTMPVAGQMIDTLNAIFADPTGMSDFLIAVGAMIGTVHCDEAAYRLVISDKDIHMSDINEPYRSRLRLERVGMAIENIRNKSTSPAETK